MFLQELGDEMFVIISNTVQSKINLFIKFILDDHYQLEFVTIIAQNPLLFIIYTSIKQGMELLTTTSCHRLPNKF